MEEDRLKSSLDSLFLVLLSLITFVIGLIYSIIGLSVLVFIIIFILVFFGLFVIPFWYGQIRGNLLEDSLKLRLLGWYLLACGAFSSIMTVVYFYISRAVMGSLIMLLPSEIHYLSTYVAFSLAFEAFILYLLWKVFPKIVTKFVEKLQARHSGLDFGRVEGLGTFSFMISVPYVLIVAGCMIVLEFLSLLWFTPILILLTFSCSLILFGYIWLWWVIRGYLKD